MRIPLSFFVVTFKTLKMETFDAEPLVMGWGLIQ
jgi:hypothetical protein